MQDFKKLTIKLMKHETFDGMAKSRIEDYCGIANGWLGKILRDEVKSSWDTCRKLAEACSLDLHVVASELSPEEAEKRRKTFIKRQNKRINDNANKQKKSLIKG